MRLAHRNRHVADTPSNEMILHLVHALVEEGVRGAQAASADARAFAAPEEERRGTTTFATDEGEAGTSTQK